MVGRKISKDRPLSPFGCYLVELCKSHQVVLTNLADIAGGKSRLSYALRGRGEGRQSRGALLSFAQLSRVCHRLRATPAETQRLMLLGLLEHAPRELRSAVIGLVNEFLEMIERLPRQYHFDFSGKSSELPLLDSLNPPPLKRRS